MGCSSISAESLSCDYFRYCTFSSSTAPSESSAFMEKAMVGPKNCHTSPKSIAREARPGRQPYGRGQMRLPVPPCSQSHQSGPVQHLQLQQEKRYRPGRVGQDKNGMNGGTTPGKSKPDLSKEYPRNINYMPPKGISCGAPALIFQDVSI